MYKYYKRFDNRINEYSYWRVDKDNNYWSLYSSRFSKTPDWIPAFEKWVTDHLYDIVPATEEEVFLELL